jgi:hypothetical protein
MELKQLIALNKDAQALHGALTELPNGAVDSGILFAMM